MNACVIIPAFNEACGIGSLIDQVNLSGLKVIVIDDGSIDDTSKIAQLHKALVLRNDVNLGKGASLALGYNYALSLGFDAVISMDGDGQHSAQEIKKFLEAAEKSPSGIIIGNRMLQTRNMPWLRTLTNQFMSWLISLITGQNIPDSQCGFRLIKKELLDKISLRSTKYEAESEILIKASRLGFKIESVPIKTIYGAQKSQINPFVDTLRFIRFIFTQIWRR